MKVGIIGNGLVSLSLAKALVNLKICVENISTQKKNTINQFRTIGITKSNIDFYSNKILDINNLGWKIKKIEIFNEKFKEKKLLNFQSNKKELFSIIKNHQLYDLLKLSLKNNRYYKKTKKLSDFKDYNLIVNCDHNHPITKKLFYKNIKKKYRSFAYITSINHKKISDNFTAIQFFTKIGPIAFLPISDKETSIVYSINKAEILRDVDIINLIKKYNPKYSIIKINKIQNFELGLSNLRSYYHENILAFGDLLHRIHPLAGQGFNMTIRDIMQLVKIISSRINLGLEIDNSVCLNFEKKMRHKNYIFSNGIDFIHEFFKIESKIKNNNLSKIVQFFGKNKSLNKFFTKFANDGLI